jgi:hypothetical protein
MLVLAGYSFAGRHGRCDKPTDAIGGLPCGPFLVGAQATNRAMLETLSYFWV